MSITTKEIAFLAEQENIGIIPRYSTNGVELVGTSMPKLKALQKTQIPLWLAVLLKKQNKCNIIIPDWLSVPYLTEKYKEEKRRKERVTQLPWHWIPTAKILLESCPDDFIDSPHQLRTLVQDLREIRLLKTRQGFAMIEDNYLELTGLTLLEINEIRPFLTKTMDTLRSLKRVTLDEDEIDDQADDVQRENTEKESHIPYRGFDDENDADDDVVYPSSDNEMSFNTSSNLTTNSTGNDTTLVDTTTGEPANKRRRVHRVTVPTSNNNNNSNQADSDSDDDVVYPE